MNIKQIPITSKANIAAENREYLRMVRRAHNRKNACLAGSIERPYARILRLLILEKIADGGADPRAVY